MSNNIDVFDEEIDIKTILVFFNRNKNNLIKIFSLILFPSLIFVSQIKSTYKGNFKIEINKSLTENNDEKFKIKKKEIDTRLGENVIKIELNSSEEKRYSEFLIEKRYLLLSAATLDSIYEEVHFNKNKNAAYDFDGWFRSYIDAQMTNNILSINVLGKDKKEILLILNLIQEKYKELNLQHKDLDLFVTTSPLITGDITPNKSPFYFFALIFAFFVALTFVFIRQKLSGIVYGLSEYKRLIELDFLETVSFKNLDLTKKLLLRSLEKKQIKSNIGVIFYKFRKEENKILISQILSSLKNEISEIEIENEELIRGLNKIIIFISNGEITYDELEMLNFYIKIYQNKVFGWVFVE